MSWGWELFHLQDIETVGPSATVPGIVVDIVFSSLRSYTVGGIKGNRHNEWMGTATTRVWMKDNVESDPAVAKRLVIRGIHAGIVFTGASLGATSLEHALTYVSGTNCPKFDASLFGRSLLLWSVGRM